MKRKFSSHFSQCLSFLSVPKVTTHALGKIIILKDLFRFLKEELRKFHTPSHNFHGILIDATQHYNIEFTLVILLVTTFLWELKVTTQNEPDFLW